MRWFSLSLVIKKHSILLAYNFSHPCCLLLYYILFSSFLHRINIITVTIATHTDYFAIFWSWREICQSQHRMLCSFQAWDDIQNIWPKTREKNPLATSSCFIKYCTYDLCLPILTFHALICCCEPCRHSPIHIYTQVIILGKAIPFEHE